MIHGFAYGIVGWKENKGSKSHDNAMSSFSLFKLFIVAFNRRKRMR
jgi:hypothetical protein